MVNHQMSYTAMMMMVRMKKKMMMIGDDGDDGDDDRQSKVEPNCYGGKSHDFLLNTDR